MENSNRFFLRAAGLAALCFPVFFGLTGCTHIALHDRLEPDIERPAAPAGAVLENLRPVYKAGKLRLEELDSSSEGEGGVAAVSWRRYRFSFQTYCELTGDYRSVQGEYSRVLEAEKRGPYPLIAVSPILGGEKDSYLASRFIARECCRRGMCAFFLYQERSILSGQKDAFGLEARMRQSVRDTIQALNAFSGLDETDPGRLGSFGVSLGALRNLALLAAEPRLRANVLCLGGLDLAEILQTSNEPMVLRYLQERESQEELAAGDLLREFKNYLPSNPKNLVGGISPNRVLLYLAAYDQVVPYSQGLALRQMLGAPEAYLLPLGHYSSLLAAPWITDSALEWVSRQWAVTP